MLKALMQCDTVFVIIAMEMQENRCDLNVSNVQCRLNE